MDMNRDIERARRIIRRLDPDILAGEIDGFWIRAVGFVNAKSPDEVKEYIDLVEGKIRELKSYEDIIGRGVRAHDTIVCGYADFGGIIQPTTRMHLELLSEEDREKAGRILAVLRSGIEKLETILRNLKYFYGFVRG